MSEITCRYVVVALPESFAIEPNKNPDKEPNVTGLVRVVEGPETGREIQFFSRLQGGAAEVTMKQLRALGWNCNDITALTGLGSVKADCTGRMGQPNTDANGKTWPARMEYSFWPSRIRPTLRAEDQKAFAAKFKAMAAGLKDSIVPVTAETAAPATLPEARATNGAAAPVSGPDADALF